ncbi:hypothetical protein DXN05_16930 [Deminuibacter soli]|uniref:Uncharacterized protein n=1 Tax=Deminuibacter soli TaxID=2291815 RepID=A0A3E1NH17_9BACT|nr:hypothetical protein DXN05_16930 [Deminuibacter soli]
MRSLRSLHFCFRIPIQVNLIGLLQTKAPGRPGVFVFLAGYEGQFSNLLNESLDDILSFLNKKN